MLVLGIETSCDETSLALLTLPEGVDFSHPNIALNQCQVLSSVISSQISTHKQFGGVVPEVGARKHAEQIHDLFRLIVKEAAILKTNNSESFSVKHFDASELEASPSSGFSPQEQSIVEAITHIFVTVEPGLVSALRVGTEFAKTLAFFIKQNKPSTKDPFPIIHPVNHLKGHVASCFFHPQNTPLKEDLFPHLHLLVSGGNTQLILLNSWRDWQIVGQTLDDAAGETFDKIGRMLGFPYPAGVYVAKTAGNKQGNPCDFPIGMSKNASLNFSYSGLKTAVRYHTQKQNIPGFAFEKPLDEDEIKALIEEDTGKIGSSPKLEFIQNVCISAQTVILQQLLLKTKKAIKLYNPRSLGLSGGVSANQVLRRQMAQLTKQPFFLPHSSLTGDNAVMIALAGLLDAYQK